MYGGVHRHPRGVPLLADTATRGKDLDKVMATKAVAVTIASLAA